MCNQTNKQFVATPETVTNTQHKIALLGAACTFYKMAEQLKEENENTGLIKACLFASNCLDQMVYGNLPSHTFDEPESVLKDFLNTENQLKDIFEA